MDLIELTQKLISIRSYVDEETNERELGEWIFGYLLGLGNFHVEKQTVKDDRFNVIAHDGHSPRLMFCCHMDTVLASGQWLHPRFAGGTTDRKIYGLGAVDMKGGTASLLHALQSFAQTKGLFLLFDVDEEYDLKGILKFLEKYQITPELAVFPEPGDLEIHNGHRGLIEISFRVRGATAHASRPELGRNAILGATRAVQILTMRLGEYEHPVLGRSVCNLAHLHGGIDEEGRIGNQSNKIPDIAEVVLDLRPATPDLRAQRVLDIIREQLESNGFRMEQPETRLDFGSLYISQDNLRDFESLVRQQLGEAKYADIRFDGFGEGQLVNERLGVNCVYFGPGPKDIAHQVDEFVEISQLEKASAVYRALIAKYCAT